MTRCPDCHTPTHENYCPECGQWLPRNDDRTWWTWLLNAAAAAAMIALFFQLFARHWTGIALP